jgi:hypothetical protein
MATTNLDTASPDTASPDTASPDTDAASGPTTSHRRHLGAGWALTTSKAHAQVGA